MDLEGSAIAGAEVNYEGHVATLDARGRASLGITPQLTNDVVRLAFTRNGITQFLTAECVPPLAPTESIEWMKLLVRREIATGRCVLITMEIRQGGLTRTGRYTPERFDDQPCSPWR